MSQPHCWLEHKKYTYTENQKSYNSTCFLTSLSWTSKPMKSKLKTVHIYLSENVFYFPQSLVVQEPDESPFCRVFFIIIIKHLKLVDQGTRARVKNVSSEAYCYIHQPSSSRTSTYIKQNRQLTFQLVTHCQKFCSSLTVLISRPFSCVYSTTKT